MENQKPLFVKIVRDVSKERGVLPLNDLLEAVKQRCSRLKIRFVSGQVVDAVKLLEREGIYTVEKPTPPAPAPKPLEAPAMKRSEVKRILTECMSRAHITAPVPARDPDWPADFPGLVEVQR